MKNNNPLHAKLHYGLRTFSALLLIGSAQAATITLIDSGSFISYADTGPSLTINASSISGSGLTTTGGDKLVITIAGEGTGNGTSDNTVTGVTFGTVAMTQTVDSTAGSNRRVSIWYLDLATISLSNSDFVINFAGEQEGIGFGAYTLSGTKAGDATTTASIVGSSDLSITTTTANEFVIATAVRNNWDAEGPDGVYRVQAPLKTLFYEHITQGTPVTDNTITFSGPTAGATAVGAYAEFATAGTQTLTIYDMGGPATISAASFQAIPEPSSMVLLGLGGMLLAQRRRR